MSAAYICDAVRTPIGRYGGALASVHADDLGAGPKQKNKRFASSGTMTPVECCPKGQHGGASAPKGAQPAQLKAF